MARQKNALHLIGVALVKKQDRVNIAVAGVKDVRDPQIVPLADFDDVPENMGQLGARHHPILSAIGGRETSDRPEGRFAALPDGDVFGLLAGPPGDRFADGSAVRLHDLTDRPGLAIEAGVKPVDLDDQHGPRLDRKTEPEGHARPPGSSGCRASRAPPARLPRR